MIAKLKECTDAGGLEIADVIRCRRSALLYNVHPLPVFSPLDDIKVRTAFELGDLVFSTKTMSKRETFASALGYSGPGWMHRVQAEFLMHTGVLSWGDLSHTLTASAHLPSSLLAEPLEAMEKAWRDDRTLAKLSVNSLIGLWAIDEASVIKVRTSSREDDDPREGCLTTTLRFRDPDKVADQ